MAEGIVRQKTRIIDIDLKGYFDNVRQDLLLAKVVQRVNDEQVMHLLKLILRANGKRGVSQGGVISPVLSNLYLNAIRGMGTVVSRTVRFDHVVTPAQFRR